MSGKGSAPRPFDVPREQFESNFDRIFRKKGYGYCPECGAEGVQRERRPNGDDYCANGHIYPSSAALAEPRYDTTPEEDEAWQQMEQERGPVMAADVGELCLTTVDDVLQADMLAELEQENRLLRARNERLEHRLRELGEELP